MIFQHSSLQSPLTSPALTTGLMGHRGFFYLTSLRFTRRGGFFLLLLLVYHSFSNLRWQGEKKLAGLNRRPPTFTHPKLLWDFQWEKMDLNPWEIGHCWEPWIHFDMFLWDCKCCLFYMQNSYLMSSDLLQNHENSFHASNLGRNFVVFVAFHLRITQWPVFAF